jgi:sarcosine oxidase subunit gamma
MPELLKQDSPLAEIPRSAAGTQKDSNLSLSEYAATGFINLRRDAADAGFVKLVEQATNVRLPETPNTSVSTSGISALWLGPHEWLIVTPGGLEAAMQDSLRKALANRNYAVTDVSSGNIAISLAGKPARDILAKGCGIDLHERYFVAGTCVSTQVAKANALVWRPDSSSRFDLIVRRSFAEYLALWLLDAGREYGLKFCGQAATTVTAR